jgi:hypothetical protein
MSDLIDEATARKFIELIHTRAANALSHLRRPGHLQLISISPDDKGMTISAFAINDVASMFEAAVCDAKAGRNCFVELRTTRAGRPRERGRGRIESSVGIFGFGIDHDFDVGKAGHVNGSDTTVTETSPGNFQELIFLDRALDWETAKPLGDMIRAASHADHCSGVVTGCFRIPGLLNFPNLKKRQRGRVVVQAKLVRVSDRLWTPDEIRTAFATESKSTPPAKRRLVCDGDGRAYWTDAPVTRRRRAVAKKKIAAKVNSKTDRSAAFQSAVNAAARAGMSPDQIEAEMRDNPSGPQQKYISEGTDRLRVEIDRSYAKAEQQQAEEQAQRDAEHAERVEAGKGIDGAQLLDRVYEFLGRFVAYPSKDAQTTHTLWIAHTHLIQGFDTTPRIALSALPQSGKTRALEVSELLVPYPILSFNLQHRIWSARSRKPTITKVCCRPSCSMRWTRCLASGNRMTCKMSVPYSMPVIVAVPPLAVALRVAPLSCRKTCRRLLR